MNRLQWQLVAAASLAVLSPCCGPRDLAPKDPPLYPVRGRLTVGGVPAVGATIRFFPNQVNPTKPGTKIRPARTPAATVGPDGHFSASYRTSEDGVPAGTYKLLVIWLEEPDKGGLPQDRLRGKYFDEAKPVAIVNVKPGPNALEPIDLTP
jgi:hypothetical protein